MVYHQEGSFSDRRQKAFEWCDSKIAYYGKRASKYGNWLWIYKVFGLLFSVSVTVLSGIAYFKNYPWSITVAGGLATFFTGMLTTTKTQEYYLNAGSLRGRVSRERLLYVQQAGPYATLSEEDQLRLFGERIVQIDASGEEDWLNRNQPAKDSN